MEHVDCVVVGAGVVGLAIARRLAQQGRGVIILEREAMFGSITSSRNSEVIHAGIYYPTGSLKAELCVQGRELLYDFCHRYQVPHKRCGKLIVATNQAQESELDSLQSKALANGVTELQPLTQTETAKLEPELACTAALLSSATGIIDAHSYMLSLLGQAEADNAILVCRTSVERLEVENDGIVVFTAGEQAMSFKARCVINSTGLDAPLLAQQTQGLSHQHVPKAFYAKGHYFTLTGRPPFSRLIYPVPEPGGLGVHLTLDLGGQGRFGPDVEWVDRPNYDIDRERSERFYSAIRQYWPDLKDGSLEPGYVGVRPKISGPSEAATDFRIDGPSIHEVPGLINLFGIESPGLTASLAIAERVADIASNEVYQI